MTFSATTSRYTYSGNGVTVSFSFPRYVLAATDLVVSLVDDATDVVTAQSLGVHYEVTDLDTVITHVVFIDPPPSGKTVSIYQATFVVQPVDLGGVTQLPMQALEDQLDRTIMLIDELQQAATRTIYIPITGTDYDAQGNRIINVADPIDPNDALNLQYFLDNTGHPEWGTIIGTLSDQADLQTALNGKANTVHTHVIADTTGLQAALDGKASTAHTHPQSDITNLTTDLAAKVAKAGDTMTGKLVLPATTASRASTTLPHGTAPTTPVDGDVWTTASGLFCRVSGITKGPFIDNATGVATTVITSDTVPVVGVVDGTLWWNSVNGQLYIYYDDGNSLQWVAASTQGGGGAGGSSATIALAFIIDGGGSVITTGVKGDLHIPFDCTITEWTLLADQSGSVVVDVWKDSYANYPPTIADVITASAKPTISGAAKAQSSTLTGWTTAIVAGSTLRFNVNSISTITRVTLSLKATRT